MLTLKTNAKPDLPICRMKCDEPLDKKLNDYELTKFMNTHTSNLIIGRPHSGKSSLIYSWFKSKKMLANVFHNVYVFAPAKSINSMADPIFSKLPEDQVFNDLTQETLQSVIDRIEEADDDENHCILMDDMGAKLKDASLLLQFKTLMMNRRHMHVSIYFMVQTWKSTHKEIRSLFSNLFIFKVSKFEMKSIFDELIECHVKLIDKIAKLVFDKKFNFLFYNVDSMRMFKNFDEILIEP